MPGRQPTVCLVRVNPYQAPQNHSAEKPDIEARAGEEFRRLIESGRKARQQWSARCYRIAGGLVGVALLLLDPLSFYRVRPAESLPVGMLDLIAAGLILFGVILFVFGPISWFWFRRRNDLAQALSLAEQELGDQDRQKEPADP